MATYGESLAALREYVTGGQEPQHHAPEGQVRLEVTHSVLSGNLGTSRNYPLSDTIANFKDKLQRLVGTSPAYMKLQLLNKEGHLVCNIDNDNALLAHYNPRDGMRVHVIDIDPSNTMAALQDTSRVEKYVMSDEEYNKREGTYRKFKDQQNAGMKSTADEQATEELSPTNINIGDRCEVDSEDGSLARRGCVKYIGKVAFGAGYWVGVQFDEPLGKNDGSVAGKRYFQCPPKYGGFVKPNKIRVGDYPEEDFDEI